MVAASRRRIAAPRAAAVHGQGAARSCAASVVIAVGAGDVSSVGAFIICDVTASRVTAVNFAARRITTTRDVTVRRDVTAVCVISVRRAVSAARAGSRAVVGRAARDLGPQRRATRKLLLH